MTEAKAPKLISMKRSAKDKRKDAGSCAPMEAMAPDYPWGLVIHLDKDEIDKLGMKKLPGISSEFGLHVKVKITRINQSAAENAEDQTSVDLQITDMAVVPPGD